MCTGNSEVQVVSGIATTSFNWKVCLHQITYYHHGGFKDASKGLTHLF